MSHGNLPSWISELRRYGILILLLALAGLLVPLSQYIAPARVAAHSLSRFSSCGELEAFVQSKPSSSNSMPARGSIATPGLSNGAELTSSTAADTSGATPTYSSTNNQVSGADEPDTVKSDGRYLYTVTGNEVIIIDAFPVKDLSLVSRISVNATILGLLLYGERLAIIEGAVGYRYATEASKGTVISTPVWYQGTTVQVYNIANRMRPNALHRLSLNGSYVGARLVSDYLYLVTTERIYLPPRYMPVLLGTPIMKQVSDPCSNVKTLLPHVTIDGADRIVHASEIYHSDTPDYSNAFTQVASIEMNSGSTIGVETFLIGGNGALYSSTVNLYLTSPSYTDGKTVIHRIALDRGHAIYQATGSVSGSVLNQYAMDEYRGYFRIATASWASRIQAIGSGIPGVPPSTMTQGISQRVSSSSVYVLDMQLQTVGSLVGIGEKERFHSARFIGERVYLVTFKKTDPLFVIDLMNPIRPVLLGELVMPGYSDYLQQLDQTHLIGIGKEAVDSQNGDFAWYQGVKVSLFDVSNPTNPKEASKYDIGTRGTDTPVLTDGKALLLNSQSGLMALPVGVYENDSGITGGAYTFQGAYVFTVTSSSGIIYNGRITHYPATLPPSHNYAYAGLSITRILYIEDFLYTVSSARIMINKMSDLSFLASIDIAASCSIPYLNSCP